MTEQGFTVGVNVAALPGGQPSEAIAIAQRLERLGFDSAEFAESAHDSFLLCALAIEHTSRVQVHTNVAISFPRSPMVTAMAAWDLDRMSGGRFVLGLGSQVKAHIERRFGVPWTAPAPRMREYVGAMRAAWHTFETGDRLNYSGEQYALSLMAPNFNPGPNGRGGSVPVHLAAVNANNTAVAGEVADGLKLHPFHSPSFLRTQVLPALERGRARGGNDRPFAVSGGGIIATGKTEADVEAAIPAARRWISFYGSTPAYFPVFEEHGFHDIGPRLREYAGAGRWDEMPGLVPDEVLNTLAIVATYDRLPDELRSRYGGLITHVSFNDQLLTDPDDDALASLVRALQARAATD